MEQKSSRKCTVIDANERVECLKDERVVDHGVVVELTEEANVGHEPLVVNVIRPT